jgi:hypothetical protein
MPTSHRRPFTAGSITLAEVEGYVSPKSATVAHDANAVLAASDFGKIHTNTGAGAGITLTLPDAATVKNQSLKVQITAAQTVDLVPPAGKKVFLGGSGVVDKYCRIAGVIGNYADVVSDGTDYLVIGYSGVLTKQA